MRAGGGNTLFALFLLNRSSRLQNISQFLTVKYSHFYQTGGHFDDVRLIVLDEASGSGFASPPHLIKAIGAIDAFPGTLKTFINKTIVRYPTTIKAIVIMRGNHAAFCQDIECKL